mmetsp:Transcript_4881/g.12587  ORF Transcript_4881/g.12587 Transcript_4881/m.12587 type:complete len:243 (-) Transcript_4881:49-777(-)
MNLSALFFESSQARQSVLGEIRRVDPAIDPGHFTERREKTSSVITPRVLSCHKLLELGYVGGVLVWGTLPVVVDDVVWFLFGEGHVEFAVLRRAKGPQTDVPVAGFADHRNDVVLDPALLRDGTALRLEFVARNRRVHQAFRVRPGAFGKMLEEKVRPPLFDREVRHGRTEMKACQRLAHFLNVRVDNGIDVVAWKFFSPPPARKRSPPRRPTRVATSALPPLHRAYSTSFEVLSSSSTTHP